MDLESSSITRLIVHQFDAARPSPGGIDTCIRGLCRYSPDGEHLAIVGVDTGNGPAGRKLGTWETHNFGDRKVFFLPVVRLDPGNQSRKIPHSLRLMTGLLRFRTKLPKTTFVQAHRMDIGLCLLMFFRRGLVYFIHTQKSGLTGKTSDSMWRYSGWLHEKLEAFVSRSAADVRVFNPDYSRYVRKWNPRAQFSPTWFDPSLLSPTKIRRPQICWVGRLEVPKDPALAIRAFATFLDDDKNADYELQIVGVGTQLSKVKDILNDLPKHVQARVHLRGRLSQGETAQVMGQSQLFLMTSHPGYEGYPRVLVEALASGLPSVVTEGSDTGGLVKSGINGFITSRNASDIAANMKLALDISSQAARETVSHLGAPVIVQNLFDQGLKGVHAV